MKKVKTRRKVEKALSPEETTALSNIQSILSEILQMGPAEEEMVEEPIAMAEEDEEDKDIEKAAEEDMDEEDDDVEKGLETTPSESETASDDAVTRLEEVLTEQTEENVSEVAKALLTLLSPKKVKKSKKTPTSELTKVLETIVEVQKSSQEQVSDLSEAFGNIIQGLGISKQIEVSKSSKKKPAMDQDNQAVLALIQKALGVKKEEPKSGLRENSSVVRKNLGNIDVLKGLVGS